MCLASQEVTREQSLEIPDFAPFLDETLFEGAEVYRGTVTTVSEWMEVGYRGGQ